VLSEATKISISWTSRSVYAQPIVIVVTAQSWIDSSRYGEVRWTLKSPSEFIFRIPIGDND
jgi:hypothetical protein